VFLNGSILGMSHREVRRKFDEIVAFADIGDFIDTPVKRYSSGMYVRLAFAVAAHLEPEILLVDEVLAVGDAQFQRKCLGKMESVSKEKGRTVLFVSHNMSAINSLCPRSLYLSQGHIKYLGNTSEAILRYYAATGGSSPSHVIYSNGEFSDDTAELLSGQVDPGQRPLHELTIHDSVAIRMVYRVRRKCDAALVPNFHFMRMDGTLAFMSNATRVSAGAEPGKYEAVCVVPGDMLNDGAYIVGLALTSYTRNAHKLNFFDSKALSFNLRDPMDERSNRYGLGRSIPGIVRPKLQWSLQRVE
jgi:lipopolysaccharide transport system ATP-binding protein